MRGTLKSLGSRLALIVHCHCASVNDFHISTCRVFAVRLAPLRLGLQKRTQPYRTTS